MFKEFILSRRTKKGVIMNIAGDDNGEGEKKSRSGRSKNLHGGQATPVNQREETKQSSEDESAEEGDYEYVTVEEPRDQWDCESITCTRTH